MILSLAIEYVGETVFINKAKLYADADYVEIKKDIVTVTKYLGEDAVSRNLQPKEIWALLFEILHDQHESLKERILWL